MKILSRQDIRTGKIFVNIVLTNKEALRIIDGKVVNGEEPYLSIQIVGYGEDESKGGEHEQDKNRMG